ncbi:MAG TPA: glycosyltransferase family 39 protein [Myxococcota bacterium]|nr:glycosyltransferase family 39 protein [Myxococcota bacterium]
MRRAFVASLAVFSAALVVLPESWSDGFAHMLVGARFAAHPDPRLLTGIWLPLLHLCYAALVRLSGEVYWTCRALTPLCGAATVAAAFALARKAFPDDRHAPALAALLTAGSPHFLFFSTYAMTEVPAALFVTLAAWYALDGDRPVAAAAALAPALWLRFELWPFAALLWALGARQARARLLAGDRRALTRHAAAAAVLAVPPAAWLVFSAAFAGDPLHSFHESGAYFRNSFFTALPAWEARDLPAVAFYLATFFITAGACVPAAVAGAALAWKRPAVRALAVLAAGHFMLLVVAYLLRMNAGWIRYWIPAHPLVAVLAAGGMERSGARLAAWVRVHRPAVALADPTRAARLALAGFAVAVYAFTLTFFYPSTFWSAHAIEIGAFLRAPAHGGIAPSLSGAGKIYSDEPAVPVTAGLPLDRFVDAGDALPVDPADPAAGLSRAGVRFIVWSRKDYNHAARWFPDPTAAGLRLVYDPPANDSWIAAEKEWPCYLYALPPPRAARAEATLPGAPAAAPPPTPPGG